MRKLMIIICVMFVSLLLGCNSSKYSNTDSFSSLISSKSEEPCIHEPLYINGIDATCFDDGYSEYVICKRCGEVLEKYEVIPSHHNMKPDSIVIGRMQGYKRPIKYACESCGKVEYRELSQEELGLPIITIKGSLEGISKEDKVQVEILYEDEDLNFETIATMKYQGSSSLWYPKHNFNIQFLKDDLSKNKIEVSIGWGKESKYCIKANYVDFSEARNVVSAKLYGEIVHSREINDEYDALVNGGAIDGFPVVMYYEDEFFGLYTFNIPKDKWLFGMGKGEKEALLMGDSWSKSVSLERHINEDFSNGWELEYCSTDDASWVRESFNEMIDVLEKINSNGAYIDLLDEYINVERAIDSMLFTFMIEAADNSSKNILWATYDGKKWMPSVYDMDGVMGLYWDGKIGITKPSDYMPKSWSKSNVLWDVLMKYKKKEVKERYFELRDSIMNIEHIEMMFSNFMGSIPNYLYEADGNRWPLIPSQSENNLNQIVEFMDLRLKLLDRYFNSIKE